MQLGNDVLCAKSDFMRQCRHVLHVHVPNSYNSTWHESGGFDLHDYVPLSAADIISRQV